MSFFGVKPNHDNPVPQAACSISVLHVRYSILFILCYLLLTVQLMVCLLEGRMQSYEQSIAQN